MIKSLNINSKEKTISYLYKNNKYTNRISNIDFTDEKNKIITNLINLKLQKKNQLL